MGILDRLETTFVAKFGPFIQEKGTNKRWNAGTRQQPMV